MTRARRIRLAFAAVVLTPLLAACTVTGDLEITEQSLIKVNVLVKDAPELCDQYLSQTVQGLTVETLDEDGECRVTGTAQASLAAALGTTVTRDESGYRLVTAEGTPMWSGATVDLKVRFPGPITEVDGAEQVGPNEVRVTYNAIGDAPVITVASRSGFGPSKVEWAAGAGLLTGVGLTLLVIWLIHLRRRRLQVAIDWPAPEGFPAGADADGPPHQDDAAFWSGRDEPAPPVVGERRRSVVDPSTWAPPPS